MAAAVTKLSKGSTARFGALLSMLIGAAMLPWGISQLIDSGDSSVPFLCAVVVIGVMELLTGLFTLWVSRVGWAFGLSLNGTLSAILFFGAPKLRDAYELDLSIALLPATIVMITTVLLATGSDDF